MKNISKLVLGMLFVFGMTSMADTKVAEAENVDAAKKMDCYYAFVACDNHAPDDYGHFMECMDDNGC